MPISILLKEIKERAYLFDKEQKKQIIEALIGHESLLVPLPNNDFTIQPIKEIIFVRQLKKNKTFIQTARKEIEFCNDSFNLIDYLLDHYGDMFKYANNGLILNKDKMVNFDSYYNKIYFTNNKEIIVTGAAINNIAQKILGKSKDLYIDPFGSKKVRAY